MFKRKKSKNTNRNKKTGQSTVEYVILVAAVLVVLIIFLKPDGTFSSAFNATLVSGTNGMEEMANRLQFSRP